MRKPTLVAAVLSLCACSPEALARLEERATHQVNELTHSVRVRFEEGAARLTVTRRLSNDTREYQSLQRHLTLPQGAIATALRVTTDDGAAPIQATLTSSEDAVERWSTLTSPGDAAPATLAMLTWSGDDGLDLDLFGIAPGTAVNVEYELELAPWYEAGELKFEYPREDELTPQFQLISGRLDHTEGSSAEGEDTGSAFLIRQQVSIAEGFEARWATYPLEVDRALWRLEVDTAPQLAVAPQRPNVVFVIDGSYSQRAEGIAAQLELIEPYLANATDAQVEIVIYRRFAERLFGRFVPASDVPRMLATLPAERFAPANGSNLDLGAQLAAQVLASTAGTGRMVVFTDEQVPFSLSTQAAIDSLVGVPRDTVVHLVVRDGSSGQLSEVRDDSAELAVVPSAYGGVYLRVGGHALDPVLSADTMRGLVRPTRIDSFAVEGSGLELEELSLDGELREGSSIRKMSLSAQPSEEVVITGKIWARDVRRVVRLDRSLAHRLPGLSIGENEVRSLLSEEELKTVAFVSHAVSPVTSYFAAPPAAAASTAGTVEGAYGSGIGSLCGGCRGSNSSCGFGTAGRAIDYSGLLQRLLSPGRAACEQRHGDASLATLALEATGDEVVAVKVSAPSVELAECLTEAAWAVRLSAEFVSHHTYELALQK